jgi:hypothetical protein
MVIKIIKRGSKAQEAIIILTFLRWRDQLMPLNLKIRLICMTVQVQRKCFLTIIDLIGMHDQYALCSRYCNSLKEYSVFDIKVLGCVIKINRTRNFHQRLPNLDDFRPSDLLAHLPCIRSIVSRCSVLKKKVIRCQKNLS